MDYTVRRSTLDITQQLEHIQQLCFPTVSADELISAHQFATQISAFPDGQFCVESPNERKTDSPPSVRNIVGSASAFIADLDLNNYEHSYSDITGQNSFNRHNPNGDWLYLADMGVHPDHRQKGISKKLFQRLRQLAHKLNLKGIVGGGLLSGYHRQKDQMSVDDYITQVTTKTLFDPTLSTQISQGFSVQGVIQNYVKDPSCDNKAALIVWDNPDYQS
jgi:GNAT superfamily N-acetyltransferase